MEGTLYQVMAALISVMLIAIIWYFWNDPVSGGNSKKDSRTPSIGLMQTTSIRLTLQRALTISGY
jgi:hypothetical protein